ncbi:MAG: flagellar hook-associated protein 3, partial [Homoserinimonas sp.]|nr:flagellar hook-associated protein 3 [Homoserinimonas sp.]
IAIEIESLRAELMNVANRQYTGRSVFAGTSSAGVAVDSTYAFAATQEVTRRIGSDSTVRVDADGASLFGSGDESVFALLDNIARDLREGTNVNSRITEIDARRTTVLGAQAAVGARQAQVDRADEINSSKSVSLEAERSDIEDIDLAKVILDLQLQENTYQAALAVTARVLQPTLMDFLR